jgi:hypothetical protein
LADGREEGGIAKITLVTGGDGAILIAIGVADARLIADAPETKREHGEMLEFLREDKAEHDRDCGGQDNCWHRDRLDLLARIDARAKAAP